MKFLATNLVTEDATDITASSSNTNFPASNLTNPLRSKRWRSSGTFIVDSTNNKIDFKESGGGAQLHATITSGTYTPTTLAAEIKTQLQTAGAQTYTVTFSTSTGLWTISSAGSYLSFLNSTGTNTATAILKLSLGFSTSDLTGSLTYTGSTVAIHTKESIIFDFQTSQDIDSVILLWPKEDGIKLSSGAVVKIQANATNVWTAPSVDQTLTIDEAYLVASHFFTSVQSYRYWRVTIVDVQNPYLFVELGMIWIGESVDFDEPENGFKFSIEDTSSVSRTEFGHEYIDEYPLIASVSFNYNVVTYATMQTLENTFRENGSKYPVIVCLDDAGTVFDKDHYLLYGKMGKSFQSDHISYNLFKGGITVTELS
jgi:hypothetical protein